MVCRIIKRRLGAYLDGEVTGRERSNIEAHISVCRDCAVEKRALEGVSYLLTLAPDVVPEKNAQSVFWRRVENAEKNVFVEKLRSLIAEWDFIPIQYSATAVLLLGLTFGLAFSSIGRGLLSETNLHPTAIEYLALNRMASIPANTITGTYLSLVSPRHEQSEYNK